jgi:dihydropyrimidine dehydrogenase (NAD+) subunit PreA
VDNGEYANWTTHPNNPARVNAAQSEAQEAAASAEPAHAAKAA